MEREYLCLEYVLDEASKAAKRRNREAAKAAPAPEVKKGKVTAPKGKGTGHSPGPASSEQTDEHGVTVPSMTPAEIKAAEEKAKKRDEIIRAAESGVPASRKRGGGTYLSRASGTSQARQRRGEQFRGQIVLGKMRREDPVPKTPVQGVRRRRGGEETKVEPKQPEAAPEDKKKKEESFDILYRLSNWSL